MDKKYTTDDLRQVVRKLTAKDGCPWDRVQTHESLKQYLIEECYEVIDAIDNSDDENLCEELGDVLFQVVFHSQLSENEGAFSLEDVTDRITKKMISRHPHIFAEKKAESIREINDSWESIKKQEKGYKNNMEILRSVPRSLPALMRSQKTVSKAYKNNMSDEKAEDVIKSINERAKRLEKFNSFQKKEQMEIIGDFLLDLTKISHFSQLNAEFSLTNALETYINRFEDIENTDSAVGEAAEDTGFEDEKV